MHVGVLLLRLLLRYRRFRALTRAGRGFLAHLHPLLVGDPVELMGVQRFVAQALFFALRKGKAGCLGGVVL